MKLYIDVLEEWDDKISDELLVNDIYLHPDEWIDGIDNESKRNGIKEILDTSFDNVYEFIYEVYENYLKMYWENLRIDYSIFTN